MFAKVAEERSFAGAARVMGVSVATVSRGVTRLEQRIGARLFNRTSRQLALTDFGLTLAERATRIYCEAEEVENTARELSSRPRGLIRLTVPLSFGLRWVAPILPSFFHRYPEVSIDLHLSDSTADLVGDGFDAALRIAALPPPSLFSVRLCPVASIVVATPAYFARHGRPSRPRELDSRHCFGFAYQRGQDTWRFSNARGEEETVTLAGPLRVNNVDALIPTILSDAGVAELPEFIAAEYLANGRMEVTLTDWALRSGAIYFVTPSARPRPARVGALAEFLAERFSKPVWVESLEHDDSPVLSIRRRQRPLQKSKLLSAAILNEPAVPRLDSPP
jgi:DNA-binding transcriptional LysR family regulator